MFFFETDLSVFFLLLRLYCYVYVATVTFTLLLLRLRCYCYVYVATVTFTLLLLRLRFLGVTFVARALFRPHDCLGVLKAGRVRVPGVVSSEKNFLVFSLFMVIKYDMYSEVSLPKVSFVGLWGAEIQIVNALQVIVLVLYSPGVREALFFFYSFYWQSQYRCGLFA